jgi:hypothetical protein
MDLDLVAVGAVDDRALHMRQTAPFGPPLNGTGVPPGGGVAL